VSYAVAALRSIASRVRSFIRARAAEKYILLAAYTSNIAMAAAHGALAGLVSEGSALVLALDIAVAAQLFIPLLILEFVPVLNYIVPLAIVAYGTAAGLYNQFTAYYLLAAAATALSAAKLEPVLTTSPRVLRAIDRVQRALKASKMPRTAEEAKFSLKISAVHAANLAVSAALYAVYQSPVVAAAAVYSLATFIAFFLGLGATEGFKVPEGGKASAAVLLVTRYPFLFRHANKLKVKLHPYIERAGVLLYELDYVAKYLAALTWYAFSLPPALLILYAVLPPPAFAVAAPAMVAVAALIYYMPFISLSSRASSRKAAVEKEYPFFTVVASVMVSAGLDLTHVFRELATGRGAAVLPAFHREARYFVTLLETMGKPPTYVLQAYADAHPSLDYKGFITGYLSQARIGGRLSEYMEKKMAEALDMLRRRMEVFVRNVVTLAEIAVIVLMLPVLVMTVGFIMAPEVVAPMVMAEMVGIIPMMGFMFYAVAKATQPEFKDDYRMRYVPSAVAGTIAAAASVFLGFLNPASAVAIVVGAIALGNYIEYLRFRLVYQEVERYLPQLFRDLSYLRQTMPVPEAIDAIAKGKYGLYPDRLRAVLARMASARKSGVKISDQPWHAGSWFWKFTQLTIAKIDETGGGTPEVFRQVEGFFSSYYNIIRGAASQLRLYEYIIYAIPLIFGFVAYSTVGIFASIPTITAASGVNPEEVASMVGQLQVSGGSVEQVLRILKGVDPTVTMYVDFTIVELSAVLGLVMAKVNYGTLRNTKILAIASFIAAAAVVVMPGMAAGAIVSGLAGGR